MAITIARAGNTKKARQKKRGTEEQPTTQGQTEKARARNTNQNTTVTGSGHKKEKKSNKRARRVSK